MPQEKRLAMQAQYPAAEHPVVRTHPETGEKVLFVSGFTTHFVNFHNTPERALRPGHNRPARAAAALPDQPGQHPRVPGALALAAQRVAIWDNRSTQHYAVMDYPPCHRKMERAAIVGDKPF